MDDYAPKKTLSTKVLGLKKEAKVNFQTIMQGCSDNGIKWDNNIIDRCCSVHASAKHPQREITIKRGVQGKRIRTAEEYKDACVSALDRAVKRVNSQIVDKTKMIFG